MSNNLASVYMDTDNRPRRFVGSIRQGNEHFQQILGGTVNDGTVSAQAVQHMRWQRLPLRERFAVWLHYVTVWLMPVLAGTAFVSWALWGAWWTPLLGTALAVHWIWQLGVLWLLRRDSSLDLVRRRFRFAVVNNIGSAFFDAGVAIVTFSVWLTGDPTKTHWVMPWIATAFAAAAVYDGHGAWKGRAHLRPLHTRRTAST